LFYILDFSFFFGIIGLQTNNTFILANENFALIKEIELKKTKFIAKEKEKFIINNSIKFNNKIIEFQENKTIYIS
jgi:hypothetical protein